MAFTYSVLKYIEMFKLYTSSKYSISNIVTLNYSVSIKVIQVCEWMSFTNYTNLQLYYEIKSKPRLSFPIMHQFYQVRLHFKDW